MLGRFGHVCAWLAIGSATLVFFGSAGCSASDDSPGTVPPPTKTKDGGAVEGEKSPEESERPAPTFLDTSEYAELVTIDAAFPFGVTCKHKADTTIAGSRWGRHDGPMVTTGTYGAGGAPVVVHWTLPADPTADAKRKERPFEIASGIPATLFYGADGMVDLPFGPFSLLSYTGTGDAFPGEALLYNEAYDAVKSRAKVNGLYSATGIAEGDRQLLVYSGLSPLSNTESSTNENGLYLAGVCDGTLAATSPCPESIKVFGWTGASGPVVTDAQGNVFVGASLSSGATSDEVFGWTKAQLLAGAAVGGASVAAVDSKGTASLAAVAPAAGKEGWVVGLGFDPKSPVYAGAYLEDAGAIVKGSALVAKAITRGSSVEGLSVFSDGQGDLWLAVVTAKEGFFLELRRKP